jgi:UDP-glucuronate 4-epimerase
MSQQGVIVTGCAGFIGYHVANRLLNEGIQVVGIDNLSSYYDVNLKKARLQKLIDNERFTFVQGSIEDRSIVNSLFTTAVSVETVIHLAAQAGVRQSIEQPESYIGSNITGFLNILEASRSYGVSHLMYASSSSVYGANDKIPYSTEDSTDEPMSFYAVTKKTNELMAFTYNHLYGLRTTGLRFFTVYGPWGRPDMALFRFTEAILAGKPIDIYHNGQHRRDFTYIDDIVEGVLRVMRQLNYGGGSASCDILNIGSGSPILLLDFIEIIERIIGKQAVRNFLPLQAGDLSTTYADMDDFSRVFNWKPATSIEQGIEHFVKWYKSYYHS